jgi:isoleucyl-tRNA synthetase
MAGDRPVPGRPLDQHRGWFHSSLLTACAMYDARPAKTTHGFTVDSKNHKMSKNQRRRRGPHKPAKTGR